MISDETLTEWEQSHAIVDDAFGVAASRQVVALIAELRELRTMADHTSCVESYTALLARTESAEEEARTFRTLWDQHGKNDLLARAERAEAEVKRLRVDLPPASVPSERMDP